jgi:hypothetical protein
MKIIIKCSLIIIAAFFISCKKEIIEDTGLGPNIEVMSVYSTDALTGEASINITNVSKEITEVGIVWSEKTNPTVSEQKISNGNIKENKIFSLLMEKLIVGKKYYVKGYYSLKGKIVYSENEVELTHSFSNKWNRMLSPTVEADSYVFSYNIPASGFNTTINCYKVNKFTNSAKPIYFFPNFDEWDVRFYNQNKKDVQNLTFEPIIAPFNINENLPATLIGGGYTKKLNGEKFFLKNFYIEGIDGYTWDPQYPGADVVATGFGIKDQAYILENSATGVLWNFNPGNIKWSKINTVPVAKNGKFLTLDVGNRAFVLLEPSDWSNKLEAFYEYIPTSNTWKKQASFTGENRRRGVFFILKDKIYYGMGQSATTLRGLKDIWEYNPETNVWKKIGDYPGAGSINMVAVGIGNFVYLGFGNQVLSNSSKNEIFNDAIDFWKFKID